MKYYAPVAPVALLEQLDLINALGKYHLVLAHDVLRHPLRYKHLFKGKGYQVIIDGGAAEEHEIPLAPSKVLEAARLVDATIIQLPDKLRDKEVTLDMIGAFLEYMPYAEIRRYNWMAIPQGTTHNEVITCANEIMQLLGHPPNFWGVPRWIANEFQTRKEIVQALALPAFRPTGVVPEIGLGGYIHLLGMSMHIDDDLMTLRMPGVMGIDSANPLVLGQQGINMIQNYQHPKREDSNFWEETTLHSMSITNILQLRSVLGV